jgi:hypothetical protein
MEFELDDADDCRQCACGNLLASPEARGYGKCKPCRDNKDAA